MVEIPVLGVFFESFDASSEDRLHSSLLSVHDDEAAAAALATLIGPEHAWASSAHMDPSCGCGGFVDEATDIPEQKLCFV